MGFIHRQRHQSALVQLLLEQLAGALELQALGCQIQQPQASLPQALLQVHAIAGRQITVQAGGGNAAALQLTHLVLHQGHQRRDHEDQALSQQGRKLITQGFTSPGWQHREAIAPRQQGLDHLALARPESRPAELLAQSLLQRIRRAGLQA